MRKNLPVTSSEYLLRDGATILMGGFGLCGVPEHLIAAVPETDSAGKLTGKLLGTPTQGAGKVSHTKAWLAGMGKQLEDFGTVHFYSDSHNDLPLMSIVSHPVATNPNAKLKQHAAEHGWPHIDLFND